MNGIGSLDIKKIKKMQQYMKGAEPGDCRFCPKGVYKKLFNKSFDDNYSCYGESKIILKELGICFPDYCVDDGSVRCSVFYDWFMSINTTRHVRI